eukprot:EG_transcript_2665
MPFDAQWAATEHRLRGVVEERDRLGFVWPGAGGLRVVAGVDLVPLPGGQHVVATLVLVDWIALELVYEAYAVRRVPADGPAAARRAAEAEVALELLRAVQLKQPALSPQLILVHGPGKLCPGGFGLASYIGAALDLPAVGVTAEWEDLDGLTEQSYLGRFEAGEVEVLLVGQSGTVWGAAYTPVEGGGRLIFVSAGHRVSLLTALGLVKELTQATLPVPIVEAVRRSDAVVRQEAGSRVPVSARGGADLRKQEEEEEAVLKQQWHEDDERLPFAWGDRNPGGPPLQYVAAAGLRYLDGVQQAVASLVVVDFERLQPVYRASGPVVLNAAPVPGFEALREYRPLVQLIQNAIKKRPEFAPQLVLVQGAGKFHARGFGVASLVGVALGIPTIGVTTHWPAIPGLDYTSVHREVESGAEAVALRDATSALLGYAFVPPAELRAGKRKALYVSVGHGLGIYTAMEVVKQACQGGSVPAPIALLQAEDGPLPPAAYAHAPPPPNDVHPQEPQSAGVVYAQPVHHDEELPPPSPQGLHLTSHGAHPNGTLVVAAAPPPPAVDPFPSPAPAVTAHPVAPDDDVYIPTPLDVPAPPAPVVRRLPADRRDFIPVKDFGGRIPGYRFLKGSQGLGYYREDAASRISTVATESRFDIPTPVTQSDPASLDPLLADRIEQLRQAAVAAGEPVPDEEVLRSRALLSLDDH